jgi:tricorn protease
VAGWTPDGAAILFNSGRAGFARSNQLFTVPKEGGFPTQLPMYEAEAGSYSPDGQRIAYTPLAPAFNSWKRYRGGRTSYIQVVSLGSLTGEKIPRDNSNDYYPMWVDDTIYFLSDRNGPFTLFAYDTAARKVRPVIENKGFDFKSASAGPGAIAYEQFGGLYLFDLKTARSQRVAITLRGDFPEVRPRWVKAANSIRNAGLSPTGVRAVFEARGEIVTVPAEKGNIRNLTRTPGVHERSPAWSPDGARIAYFSDESGEYALHIADQLGQAPVRKIALGEPPSFFYDPVWSPDNKKILFTDKRLNIWYVDLDKEAPAPVKVDSDKIYNRSSAQTPAWSPDSRWIAYSRLLDNRLASIFVHRLEDGKSFQVTDGMSYAQYPVFDRSGKYLFFVASTNVGPTQGEGLSSLGRSSTSSAYAVVLKKDLPSPLAPESDEEKVAEEKPAEEEGGAKPEGKPATEEKPAAGDEAKASGSDKQEEKPAEPAKPGAMPGKPGGEPPKVEIDFDGITTRTVALPVPARNYAGLVAGKAGTLFLVETPAFDPYEPGPGAMTVYRFDLEKRKEDKAFEGISAFTLSANGDKALVRQGPRWSIVTAMMPGRPGEGGLNLDRLEVWVDPPVEWRQMYRESWRGERDFFYSPQHHGLDLARAEQRYEPFLDSVVSRWDLNYLFQEMLGELTVSHLFVDGGDTPEVKRVPGGLLGADYRVENGRYRLARVYTGESWNPQLRAPLAQPGIRVAAGEYLIAINGVDLRPPQDLDALLEATAGKAVSVKVGPNPDGTGAREVTVVPVADESTLRHFAWIEDNRRKVGELSGGRIAYVYLPDTYMGGFTYFNRYFFAQLDKQAVLVDERYNAGGALADYVVDYLRRPLLNYITGREGVYDVMPYGAVFGPKLMLINEYAGSGGDAMPYYFKKLGIGPLMGKRTWGGLVRAGGMPVLMDGGFATAPDAALWSETGEWVGENTGIAPDIEVEQDPAAVRAGRDPQLERGVGYLLKELEKNPPKKHQHPPYRDYQQDKHWPK